MDKKELFIGAIVFHEPNSKEDEIRSICEIVELGENSCTIKRDSNNRNSFLVEYSDLKPIPFSVDFLERLGFSCVFLNGKQIGSWALNFSKRGGLVYNEKNNVIDVSVMDIFFSCENLNIHELQSIIKAKRILFDL